MQELTKARINFFTNISHDLKTPLSLIVDPLRKLKEHLPSDTPATKYASLIEKSVGRMQRMIGQLLTFREIESDRLTLDRRPGDLVSFLESIFSLFETYADRKGIEMLFHSQFESYKAAFDLARYGAKVLYAPAVGPAREKNIAINEEVYNEDTFKMLDIDPKKLDKQKASEVGNIFTLGTKYSDALGLEFNDEDGKRKPVFMGSYGIGPARTMGVIAEKTCDDKGLCWPEQIAPYKYYLIGIGEQGIALAGVRFKF